MCFFFFVFGPIYGSPPLVGKPMLLNNIWFDGFKQKGKLGIGDRDRPLEETSYKWWTKAVGDWPLLLEINLGPVLT